MRILIANDQHWPMKSGVATAAHTQATGLARLGNEVLVLAPSQSGSSCVEEVDNYKVRRIRSLPLPFRKNLRVSVTYDREISKIVKEFNPDIIHIHTQLTVGLSTLRAATQNNIPVVATNHVMPDNMIKNIKALQPVKRPAKYLINEYGLLLYKGADALVMPTDSALGLFNTDRPSADVVALSNGIDLSLYEMRKPNVNIYDKFDIPRSKHVISWLGRLDKEKHLNILVEAFAQLAKSRDDCHLLMIGSGNAEATLIDLVQEYDIQDSVTFTGLVSEEDKIELHHVPAVFVVPSPNELQCLAMLESMACGTPIVAVDAGALSELVHHDKNGYLCAVDDVNGMTRSITMILDDPVRQKTFSAESRRIAEQHDLENVIPRFLDLYERVIAQK